MLKKALQKAHQLKIHTFVCKESAKNSLFYQSNGNTGYCYFRVCVCFIVKKFQTFSSEFSKQTNTRKQNLLNIFILYFAFSNFG